MTIAARPNGAQQSLRLSADCFSGSVPQKGLIMTTLRFRLGLAFCLIVACGVFVTSGPADNAARSEGAQQQGDNVQAEEWASFQKTVQPFLTKHCYECHGPKAEDAE